MAGRPARRLLVVPQRRQALERLVLHATSLRIPVVEVEGGTLTSIAGFDGHQGIALVVEPRTYVGLDDILARSVERGEAPFILVLDSLEDPQNVGTLLRSAEAAGVHGVIFPTHHQAPLTPAAVKASAGAVEHLLLAPVDDLPAALSDLRIRGLRIAAAEADAPLTADEADLRGPLAIVVGSEGQGLAPAVRRRADLAIRIPMRGSIASLNAAVAGSILLFAAVAQRPAPIAKVAEAAVAPEPSGSTDEPSSSADPAIVDAPPAEAPASRKRRVAKATSTPAEPTVEPAALPVAESPAEAAALPVAEPASKPNGMKAAKPAKAAKSSAKAAKSSNKAAKPARIAKPAKATKPAKGAKPAKAAKAPAKAAAAATNATASAPATATRAKAARTASSKTPAKATTTGPKAPAKATTTAPKARTVRDDHPATTASKPRATRANTAAKRARKPLSADGDESSGDDLLPGGPAVGDSSPVA